MTYATLAIIALYSAFFQIVYIGSRAKDAAWCRRTTMLRHLLDLTITVAVFTAVAKGLNYLLPYSWASVALLCIFAGLTTLQTIVMAAMDPEGPRPPRRAWVLFFATMLVPMALIFLGLDLLLP